MSKNKRNNNNQLMKAKKTRKSNPPITKNTQLAYTKSVRTGSAKTKILGDGAIRVTHREFLSDVVSSTGFAVRKFAINPGDSSTFRWLSGMARLYESYVVRRLKVEFIGACSATTAGRILMAVDYDPADSSPVDKIDAASYQGSVSTSPWISESLICDPRALTKVKERYVRSQPTSTMSAGDLRSYDSGNIFVMTTGFAAANTLVGELYVDYEVDLHTPQRLNAVEDSTFRFEVGYGNGSLAGGNDSKGNGRIKDQFGRWRGEADNHKTVPVQSPIWNVLGPAIESFYNPGTEGSGDGFTRVLFRNAGKYVLSQIIGLSKDPQSLEQMISQWPDIIATNPLDGLVSQLSALPSVSLNIDATGSTAARDVVIEVLKNGAEFIFDDFPTVFKSGSTVTKNCTGIGRLYSMLQPFVGVGHELIPQGRQQLYPGRSREVLHRVDVEEDTSHGLNGQVNANYLSPGSAQSSYASYASVKQGVTEFPFVHDSKVRFING